MSPHETREFTNSVEYTVQLTFVVAGGARWRTGHARARRIAERLASAAARATGVVDVRAVAGASRDGQLLTPERVCFEAANSGHGTGAAPTRLDRYLDVDHERALVSLTEANAAARVRRQADFDRRQRIGCANPAALGPGLARPCRCAYCRPRAHLAVRGAALETWVMAGACAAARQARPCPGAAPTAASRSWSSTATRPSSPASPPVLRNSAHPTGHSRPDVTSQVCHHPAADRDYGPAHQPGRSTP